LFAQKRTQKGSRPLAASLLAFDYPALLGCVKWQKNKSVPVFLNNN
jgi:hypothetical protein